MLATNGDINGLCQWPVLAVQLIPASNKASGSIQEPNSTHLLSMLLATDGDIDGGLCSRSSCVCSSLSFLAAESTSRALHTRQRLASEIRPCRM